MKTFTSMLVLCFSMLGCGNAPFNANGGCNYYDQESGKSMLIYTSGDQIDLGDCYRVFNNLDLAKQTLLNKGVISSPKEFGEVLRTGTIYLFLQNDELPQSVDVDSMTDLVHFDRGAKVIYLESEMRGTVHAFIHLLEEKNRESSDRIDTHEDWNVDALGYADADVTFQRAAQDLKQ